MPDNRHGASSVVERLRRLHYVNARQSSWCKLGSREVKTSALR